MPTTIWSLVVLAALANCQVHGLATNTRWQPIDASARLAAGPFIAHDGVRLAAGPFIAHDGVRLAAEPFIAHDGVRLA